MLLSKESHEKAIDFINNQARPLERARYAYLSEQTSSTAVLNELAAFQNADGGFGHGLEPDFRLDQSSAICTSIALQILYEVHSPGASTLVADTLRYLLDTFDESLHVWPIIPPNDNTAPHAPWWDYAADMAAKCNNFQANPRADIVAHLFAYAEQMPATWLEALGVELLDWLCGRESLEMHDLLCYIRLLESQAVPQQLRDDLFARLRPCVEQSVVRDAALWRGYCLQPLQVVTTPHSPLYAVLADAVEENLDYLIGTQTPAGCWSPSWNWGTFPDVWSIAEREWQGVLTFNALKTLQSFGRYED